MGSYHVWMSLRNRTIVLAVIAIGIGYKPAYAQDTAFQPPRLFAQVNPGARTAQGGQNAAASETPLGKLLDFTEKSAATAGALSVCNPRAYTEVRLCGILIITHWGELGQTMPQEGGLAQTVENLWQKAAGVARDIQAGPSPPLSCMVLLDRARTLQLWELCGAARRLEAQAIASKAQNNPAGRSNTRPAAPVPTQPQSNGSDNFRME